MFELHICVLSVAPVRKMTRLQGSVTASALPAIVLPCEEAPLLAKGPTAYPFTLASPSSLLETEQCQFGIALLQLAIFNDRVGPQQAVGHSALKIASYQRCNTNCPYYSRHKFSFKPGFENLKQNSGTREGLVNRSLVFRICFYCEADLGLKTPNKILG